MQSLLPGRLLLLASCAVLFATPSEQPPKDFRVVGYLPWYRADKIDQIEFSYLTDVVYAFGAVSSTGEFELAHLDLSVLSQLVQLGAVSNTDVMISVGGASSSDGFAQLVHDPIKRQQFVSDITDFAVSQQIQGVDLDWEGPSSASDQAAYSQLMNELQDRFDPLGLKLTVVVPGWAGWVQPEAYDAIEHINLASYDGGTPHSTFAMAVQDVTAWQGWGIPSDQIVLGVPFYGKDASGTAFKYSEIMTSYAPAPDVDEVNGIHFNGIETIRRKTRYAWDKGLGGIMIWELGQDTFDEASLLSAIHEELGLLGWIDVRQDLTTGLTGRP